MRTRTLIAAPLALALGAATAHATITETFDNGFNGWTVYGDVTAFTHLTTGGNPGACLQAHDLNDGIIWGFRAGPAFLGNKRCAYGGTILWDLRISHFASGTGTSSPEIEIDGAGLTMVYNIPGTIPAGVWNSFSAPLSETAGWRLVSINGVVPTQAQFQAILSDITQIRIRAEFSSTADTDQIDNVILDTTNATCCPADLANGSGAGIPDNGIDINDLLFFLAAFEAGTSDADLAGATNGSGNAKPDGGVDIIDLLFFLEHFEAGC
jgi:hypothetical protein